MLTYFRKIWSDIHKNSSYRKLVLPLLLLLSLLLSLLLLQFLVMIIIFDDIFNACDLLSTCLFLRLLYCLLSFQHYVIPSLTYFQLQSLCLLLYLILLICHHFITIQLIFDFFFAYEILLKQKFIASYLTLLKK